MSFFVISAAGFVLGLVGPPPAPTGLLARRNGAAVELEWSGPAASGTRVERSTNAVTYAVVANLSGGAASYTDSEPVDGTSYYQVRSVDRDLVSGPSNVAAVSTGAAPGLDFADPVNSQYVYPLYEEWLG